MAENDVSCILVELDGGCGVLTDSDLRRKLVAEGLLLRHAGVAADGRAAR